MLEALSDFISKVTRGEKIRLGDTEAQWKKVAELRPGMMVAVPRSLPDEFTRPAPDIALSSDSDVPAEYCSDIDSSDVFWDEIISIKRLSPKRVWDIEVEGTHNFVAGHMIERPAADVARHFECRSPPPKWDLLSKDKTISAAERWFGGFFAHNTSIFGAGEGGTPTATTIRGAGAAGTNVAGANFTFDASNGTGSGGSGAWIFRTAPPGASGSSADTLAEALRITNTGLLGVGTNSPISRLQVTNNPTGTATTGKAALVIDQYENQNLLTASYSAATKFYVTNSSDVVGQRFVDLANSAYLLDPATTGVALNVAGRIISNSAYNESGTWSPIILKGSNDSTSVSVCIEGTATDATTCDGKIDAGTFDPPYTINGNHYATFAPSMTGVKEETTGTIITSELVSGLGYRANIDFENQPQDSDLWLFAKTTNLRQQIDKLVVLLSPAGNTRTWYTLDPSTLRLSIYSSAPAAVSYRLTAPRFDAASWSNKRSDNVRGFLINDENTPLPLATTVTGDLANVPSLANATVTATQNDAGETAYQVHARGSPVDEFLASSNAVLGHLKSGLVEAQRVSAETITVAGQPLADYIRNVVNQAMQGLNPGNQGSTLTQNVVSPVAEIGELSTNIISPLSTLASESAGIAVKLGERQTFGIYNQEGSPAATFDDLGNVRLQGDLSARQATFSGTLTAGRLVIPAAEPGSDGIPGQARNDNVLLDVDGSASISGTLYADRIVTRFGEIGQLQDSQPVASTTTTIKNEYITNIVNLIASSSANLQPAISDQQPIVDATSSALLALLTNEGETGPPVNYLASSSGNLYIPNDLTVLGSSTLGATTVAGNMTVTGQLAVGNEGLATEGFTLYIEKSRLAPVDILAGLLVVNPAGNVMINGDLMVSGNVAIGGVLGVDTIAPLSGNQLTFDLGRPDLASGSAEASSSGQPSSGFGKLVLKGPGGQTVATFDASGSARFAGDVVASGSGVFNKLVITNGSESSPSAGVNTSSAGTSILSAGTAEVAVPTTQVTDKSLIYITPITSTSNEVLYIKNRISGNSFTVGLDIALPTDVRFNWWVVN